MRRLWLRSSGVSDRLAIISGNLFSGSYNWRTTGVAVIAPVGVGLSQRKPQYCTMSTLFVRLPQSVHVLCLPEQKVLMEDLGEGIVFNSQTVVGYENHEA